MPGPSPIVCGGVAALLISCSGPRAYNEFGAGDTGASADASVAPELDTAVDLNATIDLDASPAPPDTAPDTTIPATSLPLSTCGRWIIDHDGRRVKLAGVNWYGASDTKFVPGGLDKVSAAGIARTIHTLGFNSVRLPFSNEMLHVTKAVAPADVAANPALVGKTPMDVFDAAIDALTAEGLLVILNNHTTHAMWCCNYDDDGLWYTGDYSEDQWTSDWESLATRYASNPRVIGADLRNELRIAKPAGGILPRIPNWGGGGQDDWAAAATRAGNRILAKNSRLLIVVEGLNSADDLTSVYSHPLSLNVHNRVVYEAHQYGFFRPGVPASPVFVVKPYEMMNASELQSATWKQWAYITEAGKPFTAPVWVGEFGESASSDPHWMNTLGDYMRSLDADYAYWALNGGPKAAGGDEPFGLLNDDWKTVRNDWRLTLLQSLQKTTRGPGVGTKPEDACPGN